MRKTNYKILAAAGLAFFGGIILIARPPMKLVDESLCNDVDTKIKNLSDLYGVNIVSNEGVGAIPELWRGPPANGMAEPVDVANLCSYLPLLEREIHRYPEEVLRKNLSAIYLLDKLQFFGVEYGGSSIENAIYITVGTEAEGYSRDYSSGLLHHEISSVFFRNYKFPEKEWMAANPTGFAYLDSDKQVLNSIKQGAEFEDDRELLEQGFLSVYGFSTLENDFNLFAEMAFVHPEKLKKLSEKYPRIKKKYELVKRFYQKVSKDIAL